MYFSYEAKNCKKALCIRCPKCLKRNIKKEKISDIIDREGSIKIRMTML